ncbi:MAG TPA: zinc-binding dehydrogenase [Actinocatenispora sp.]
MKALVADPDTALTMRVDDVPEPVPTPAQVVVRARSVSLNHGDLNDAVSGRIPPGGVLGSDVAGIVERPAADGSGPAAGTRVVALTSGAFATRVAADTSSVAVVPDGVDLAVASALPVAGLAAFRSLRRCGPLLGRRVLVTGASGGVGVFAVQLAAAAGAHVVASVGSPARGTHLAELGAHQVVVGLDGVDEPLDAVIDSVGGPQMVRAWDLLADGGTLQSVGWASTEPALFPRYATIGPERTLVSYLTRGPVGDDLGTLLRLVQAGTLSVQFGWRGSLADFADAASSLRERRIQGKAIMDVMS